MKLNFSASRIDTFKTALSVIPYFSEGPTPVFERLDSALCGALSARARKEEFNGHKDRTLIWEGTVGGQERRIIAVGVGAGDDAAEWRWGIGRAVRFAAAHRIEDVAILLDGTTPQLCRFAALTAEATVMSAYQFNKYKSKAKKTGPVKQVMITAVHKKGLSETLTKSAERAVSDGRIRGEAVNLARDLVNEPANVLSPTALADRAGRLAEQKGLACEIWTEREIKKQGMGLLLSVAAGSDRPPRFIHLTYRPRKKAAARIVLVGKGITFDTGGLCIKPGKSMYEMKTDMAGAAAVLGILSAVKGLGVRAEVHGIIPATDNGVNGNATRPGDVVKSLSGKTVEVLNTDAEGRLILADALTFGGRLGPDLLLDFATLTGACEVALGSSCAGLFSTRNEDAAALFAAAGHTGESVWRLPLLPDLESGLKSDIADLKNIGGRFGGAITAALFLKSFTDNKPWVHLDIAGPARLDKATPTAQKGGSGFGVLTGLAYLASL